MLPKDSCDASPSASELPSCVVPGGFFGGGGNVISSAQTAAQDRNTGKSIIADGDVAVWQVIEAGLQAKQGTEARRRRQRSRRSGPTTEDLPRRRKRQWTRSPQNMRRGCSATKPPCVKPSPQPARTGISEILCRNSLTSSAIPSGD